MSGGLYGRRPRESVRALKDVTLADGASAQYPRRGRGVAATRLRRISTSRPRRRRNPENRAPPDRAVGAQVEKKAAEEIEKRKTTDKPVKKLSEVLPPAEEFAARAEKRRRCDGLVEEAVAIARQTEVAVARHIDAINGELANLSEQLHASGEFEAAGAARPGDEVAIRLDDYDKDAWVLGRVVRFRADAATYEVADADDDSQIHELGEQRVIPLTDGGRGVPAAHVLAGAQSCLVNAQDEASRLQKGEEVFAVYPDTTSFYHAIVSIPARRSGAQGGSCHCQFHDDQDETGLNPDRPVPLKYVMRIT